MLDDEIDVGAGQDEQRDGVDRLWVALAGSRQVAAEDRAGSGGEQVRASSRQRRKLSDRFPQREVGVREASGRAVQPDLETDVRAYTAAK